MDNIMVTGGAGFIGANFVQAWIHATEAGLVITLDKLSYAGNLHNLEDLKDHPRHAFYQEDIGDQEAVGQLLQRYRPGAIVRFAAESHVDRSIARPEVFVTTNVVGALRLLGATCAYWLTLSEEERSAFRFMHISTDEVYGSLGRDEAPFGETDPYRPNSPYAASKASSDQMERAYYHTYGLPVLTTHCSNNYGRYQFPEKLIPLLIVNAIEGRPLPLYGDGLNIRDWLHVDDHCAAIRTVLVRGKVGETYRIGGNAERTNLEIAHAVRALLDRHRRQANTRHEALITFVRDRPGHDRRYAIDTHKIRAELGWQPAESFDSELAKTVLWDLEHPAWVEDVVSGQYRQWVGQHYGTLEA